MKTMQVLAMLALSAGLAACGGGSGGESAVDAPAPQQASNEVPPSASVSPESYSRYVGSLAKTETGLPLDVSKLQPPTSETALPVAVQAS